MRKLLSIFLILLLLAALPVTVHAEELLPLVIDYAGVLKTEQWIDLAVKATTLQTTYQMDVVIVIEGSLGGKPAQEAADDYYDQRGYAEDGILFLLAIEEREWYISTSGDAIDALTDYGIQASMETPLTHFAYGGYYKGLSAWLDGLSYYLTAYQLGTPVDGDADYSGDYYHGDREESEYYQEDFPPNLLLSLIIGLAAAGITVAVMRSSMNTKLPQRGAANYMKAGSFHMRTRQDLFLYSNISKVRKQQNTGSAGRSGGGSSVHRSSGGRRHGGGGGRF